jgi:hypothetical protein
LLKSSETKHGDLEKKVKTLEEDKSAKDELVTNTKTLKEKAEASEHMYKGRYEQEKEKRTKAEADLSKYRQIEAIMKEDQGVKAEET